MVYVNVLKTPSVTVRIGGEIIGIDFSEHYDGPYEIIPDFEIQTLETADKKMDNDVTVHPIPVHRTTNPYGTTVYIGGLLDG